MDDITSIDISLLYNIYGPLFRFWVATFWKAPATYNETPQMNEICLASTLRHAQTLQAL